MRRRRGSKPDAIPTPDVAASDDIEAALNRLRDHPSSVVTEILPRLVRQFASDETIPSQEKYEALRTLFYAVVTCLSQLSFDPIASIKESWSNRDRSRGESPQAFVERVYGAYIGRGLTKAHIRRADYPLYKALANPHWKKKGESSRLFSQVLTKKKSNDDALRTLPQSLTRAEFISMLPTELQEQLRLLHVLEMRKRSTTD